MPLLKEINEKLALLSFKLKLAIPINFPSELMVELTNCCNLKCPLCPTGTDQLKFKKTDMTFEQFKKIMDEMRSYIKRIYFEGFGEPLLCGDVFQIIEYSKKLKIRSETATNGIILNKENIAKKLVLSGLDTIRISLDGATEMTLRKYRDGASINDILDGIEKINYYKRFYSTESPEVVIQFIVMKHNEHEIEDIKKLSYTYKANLRLKTVAVDLAHDRDIGLNYLPIQQRFSRYRLGDDGLVSSVPQKPVCHFFYSWAFVNCDGSVVPCCRDPFREQLMGSIFERPFKQIWWSSHFINFRRRFLKDRANLKRCQECVILPSVIK